MRYPVAPRTLVQLHSTHFTHADNLFKGIVSILKYRLVTQQIGLFTDERSSRVESAGA